MMKKNGMKKLAAMLLAGVMCVSLAACGGEKKADSGSGEAAVSSESAENGEAAVSSESAESGEAAVNSEAADFSGKTLTVGIWGGNDQESAAIEKVKTDFEAKTGAKVEFKVYTEYNTQIQADFIGKTAPDVFYVDANVFPFYSGLGVMEPLDVKEMGADQYYENLIAAFTTEDGQLFSIPKDVSTLAMYYNETLLTECGFTPEDIPEKLEDFVTFLPKLQSKLDEKYGAGQVAAMTYNQDLARNLHLLERSGGQVCKEDGTSTLSDDKTIANLEFMLSLVNTGGYKTPTDLGLGWNGEVFGTGKAVIMEEGNWVYGTLKNDFSDIKFGVKDMPSYQGEKSSMSFTVGYGIFSGSSNKELAKEWIKYATGLEGMTTWCSGAGCLPSRADVAEKMDVQSDPVWATHLAQEAYAIPWQKGTTLTIINDNYKNFLPSAVKAEATAKAAMEKADKQANSEIENAQ